MRKLFWCGAAALVAAATGVYLAADQAIKHPDGYWGQCLGAAAAVGANCNPFWAAERLAGVSPRGTAAGGPRHEAPETCPAEQPVEGVAVAPPVAVECLPVRGEVIRIEWFPGEPQGDIIPAGGQSLPGQGMPPLPADAINVVPELIPAPTPVGETVPRMPNADEPPCCPCVDEGARPFRDWLWRLMEEAGLVEYRPGQPEKIPAPTEVPDGKAGLEQQGPDWSVNPNHPNHGGCPYLMFPNMCPNFAPPAPPAEKPAPEMPGGASVKTPGHLDTMEFRPTDDPRLPRTTTPF